MAFSSPPSHPGSLYCLVPFTDEQIEAQHGWSLAQGHTADDTREQDLNPDLCGSELDL